MEPSENIDNYKLGIFYFNKSDGRFVVPKREKGLGWTFNFAKARTYLFLGIILIVLFGVRYAINHLS